MPAWDHSQAGQEKGALRHEESRLAADSVAITPGLRRYSGVVEFFFRGVTAGGKVTS